MDWKDYWQKAKENLEVAAWAYQTQKHNACASRAYYAVFLASIAALLKLTDLRVKDNLWAHTQVQAEFNRRFIMRKKVFPGELGRIPMDLIELRHLADYKPQMVTSREAKRSFDRAEKFLSAIESALGEST